MPGKHPLTQPGDRASLSVALTTTYGNRRMASPGEIEKLERRWLENMQGLTFAPLAEAYRKAGRLDEAFQTLELGLAHHPDYVPAHIVRGRCALDSRDDTVAASAFALVLSFDSLNLIALRGLAEISVRSGRQQEATLHLRRLLDADPTDADALAQLAELQARATPAAADYAPSPEPSEEPSPREESLSADTVFPLVDLGESNVSGEIPDDCPATGDSDEEVGPLDLHLDEQWSSPGAGNEYAIANDSETFSPVVDIPAQDEEPQDVFLPSVEINVVPTLKDLDEAEPPIPESERDSEVTGPRVDMAAESDFDELLAQDTPAPSGETLRLLDDEAELPAHPWIPSEFPPAAAGASDSRDEGEDIDEAERGSPDPIPSGFSEPFEDGVSEAWPEGPLAVSEADPSDDAPSTVGESVPTAPAGSPEQEISPFPGAPSNAWDRPEFEGDAAPESIREEASHEISDATSPPEEEAAPGEEEAALAELSEPAEAESIPHPGGWGGWMSDADDREETTEPDSPEIPAEAPIPLLTEGEEGEDDDLVVTETMAEIFLRQGHDELALAVYTELARRDPEDARLQEAIARLVPTPAAEENPPADASAPARYAASSTGGESLGDFLVSVLAVREPISPLAITPPAMDRPREGEPTRPADRHFGLDSVFGDDPSDASVPPAATEEGEGVSPSFDEFFGERPPVVAPPSAASSESDSEDLQHFNDWLKGLKR